MYIRSIESDYFDDYEFNQENLMTGYKIIEELNAPAYIESNPTMWRELHTRNMQFGAEPTNIIFDAVSDEYKTRGAHAEVIYTGIESAFRAMQHRGLRNLTVNGRYSAAGLIAELAQAVNIWVDMQLLDIAPERDIELDFQDWGFDATILELAHSVCQYWGLEFFTSYNPTTNRATLNFTQRVGEVKEDAFQYLVDIEQTDVFYDRTDLKTVVTGYRPDGSTRTYFWEDMQLETGVHATHPSVDIPEGLTAIGEINYLQGILSDTLNYGMEVKLVESDLDYAHINIGDTIWVLDERLGMKVNIRVTKKTTHYDAVNKVRRVDLELGSRGQIKTAGIHSPMTPPGVQGIVGENIHDHVLKYHADGAEGVTDPLYTTWLSGKSDDGRYPHSDPPLTGTPTSSRLILQPYTRDNVDRSGFDAGSFALGDNGVGVELKSGFSSSTGNHMELLIQAGAGGTVKTETRRHETEAQFMDIRLGEDAGGMFPSHFSLENLGLGGTVSLYNGDKEEDTTTGLILGKEEALFKSRELTLKSPYAFVGNVDEGEKEEIKSKAGDGTLRLYRGSGGGDGVRSGMFQYHSLWEYEDGDGTGYPTLPGGHSGIFTSSKLVIHSDDTLTIRGQQGHLMTTDFTDPTAYGNAPQDRFDSDTGRGLTIGSHTLTMPFWRIIRAVLWLEREQEWDYNEGAYLSSAELSALSARNGYEHGTTTKQSFGQDSYPGLTAAELMKGYGFLERTTTPAA